MSQSLRRSASPFLISLPVTLLLGGLAATPALAAGKQSREHAARRACLSGDVNTGVTILSDLFIDTKDPTYIFNQGRCFEQNHRYEDAVSRFEEYLRVPEGHLDADDRAAAEKHIAEAVNYRRLDRGPR